MRNRGLPLEWSDKTILRMKNAIFHDYYNRIRNIALSRYEWRDLPEDMNERYIEWLLFYNGKCVFFYDEILEKYLSLLNSLKKQKVSIRMTLESAELLAH